MGDVLDKIPLKKMLILALYAGEIMLRNGAETYRVEDTIFRICRSKGFKYVESIVTPTGIYISIDRKDDETDTMLSFNKRIRDRTTNLSKVAMVNDFSRKFVNGDYTIKEGMHRLTEIDDKTLPYKTYLHGLAAGFGSGFFVLLLGANFLEFICTFISNFILMYTLKKMSQYHFSIFFSNLIGGILVSSLAVLLSLFHEMIDIDLVIVGGIMVMVPGVAITNAVRDSIGGDIISGIARAGEALVVAISIAFGVGFTLNLWNLISQISINFSLN